VPPATPTEPQPDRSPAGVTLEVSGGQIQGVAGAQNVFINNLTFNTPAQPPPLRAQPRAIPPCPYPGLAYFGPQDAAVFFGRDAAIGRLEATVQRQALTALVGASGSGKSSVVLAGLAPRMHADYPGEFLFSYFRIGLELDKNPYLALARAVTPFFVDSDSEVERLRNTRKLAELLAAGEMSLRDVFSDSVSRRPGRGILLVADQFEEIFSLVEDDKVRQGFVDTLLAGFRDDGGPSVKLVLTMRADYYGRALAHRSLADALQDHVENLGP
jgi:hypothetical protein